MSMVKETRSRERDNNRGVMSSQVRSVSWDGVVRGPDLPENPGGEWPAQTLKFYASFRKSPQAADFVDSDWDNLFMACLLHAELWSNTDITPTTMTALARQVAAITAKLGATIVDRQSAGYKDVTGRQETAAPESRRRSARVNYEEMLG